VTELKPAYLIWGGDEAKLDAWRRRLHARVESEAPAAALEVLKDERLSARATAEAIQALTLSVGRRYVLADGVERWSERDVKQLEPALSGLSPETVVVLIARGKPPKALVKAVQGCGGEVREYKPPQRRSSWGPWLGERARELGLELEREAGELLVERIGNSQRELLDNQQRLMRELEKLSIFVGEDGPIDPAAVEALTSSAVEVRAYELADAVAEGDSRRALQIAEDLRARGEDMMHILFAVLRQLRNYHRSWALVASGKSLSDVQSELRVPEFVAKRLVAQARRADGERLERALELLADLDYAIRGAGRLDPESALSLTLARAASGRRAA
jgi:DNA polymerase III subunit delta